MRRTLLIPLLTFACTSPEPLNPDPGTHELETSEAVTEVAEAPAVALPPTTVAAVDPELLQGVDETAAPALADGSQPSVEVEGGESLGLYAEWAGISADAIAERNQLTLRSKLKIGQKIEIPVQGAAADKFRQQRANFIAGRLQRFLDARGGLVKMSEHTVRRGESLWTVAQRSGRLPLWVIQSYNPGRDLDKLAVGDTIKIPITAAQTSAAR